MPLVQGTYAPPALNPLLLPVSDGPPIDNDPASPTYGQPTYSKLNPRPGTPDYGTTAKGNPGQPAPGVPITTAPEAAPQLPDADASFTMAPSGTPKAQAKTAPTKAAKPADDDVPDYLGNLKPQVDSQGKPLQAPTTAQTGAPAAQAAPAEGDAPDYLSNLKPQVDTHGKPAMPAYTGQYLTSATSPGAQAVGTPPVEGFVPGPVVQAAINTATDPAQRAAIAAHQLGLPLDRIIVGPGGRMAAVGDNGTPYYIEPEHQSSYYTPETKTDAGWQSAPFHVNPYQTPFAPTTPQTPTSSLTGFDTGQLVRGGAAMAPWVIQNALTYAPAVAAETAGGPVVGAATAGGMRYTTGALQQMIANALTPNQGNKQPVFTSQLGQDALLDALIWLGGSVGSRVAGVPELWGLRTRGPSGEGPTYNTGLAPIRPAPTVGGIPIERQQPYGFQGQLAPWEAPQRWELPPGPVTPPGNPPGMPPPGARIQPPPIGEAPPAAGEAPAAAMPVPGAVPLAPGETWLPGQAAEVGSVPAIKSDAQIAAEDRAIPTTGPTLRFPLRSPEAIKEHAADVVRAFAAGGNTVPEAGVEGSLPQVTENRGLAALMRGMINHAGPVGNEIAQFQAEQAAANRSTLAGLQGTPEDLKALRDTLEQQTAARVQRTFANTTPTDATPSLEAADIALRSPDAQRPAVAAALRDARDRLFQHDPITGKLIEDEAGNPVLISDPEQLWGVVKGLRSDMTSAAQSGRVDMRVAARQLGPLVDSLDQVIEAGAPDYAGFNQAYREARKPITAMEYLQGRNMVDPATQTPQLSAVQRTLDDIRKQQTLKSGWQPADDLSPEQIKGLTDLRDQLRREFNLRGGAAIGSPTVQNLATDQMTNALIGPVSHYAVSTGLGALGIHEFGPLGAVVGAGKFAVDAYLARQNAATRDAVYREIARLLINRNGEGTAALRAMPRTPAPPNALQQ